jgi:hypothetical protein
MTAIRTRGHRKCIAGHVYFTAVNGGFRYFTRINKQEEPTLLPKEISLWVYS